MGYRAALGRVLILLAALTSPVYAYQWEDAHLPPSARVSALGGMHAALTDDFYTIFSNPAGLQRAEREMQVSDLTIQLSGPIFDIAGVIIRAAVKNEDIAVLLADPDVVDLISGLHAGFKLSGPLGFSYAGGGLGFGFYDWAEVRFDSVGPATLETVAAETLLVTGGYSFRIPLPSVVPGTLDIGGALKTMISAGMSATRGGFELEDFFANPIGQLWAEPFALSLGVGIDLGVLYQLSNQFAVGLVGRDLFTPTRRTVYGSFAEFRESVDPVDTGRGRVRPDVSIGLRYSPRIVAIERVITRFNFLLDYNDIFDFAIDPVTARNPVLHVSLGVEAVMLQILSLRAGFGDGLLAAGLALDLTFAEVTLSMFGTELSTEPGLLPTYNVILGLRFPL
jgi:hypothetical protein